MKNRLYLITAFILALILSGGLYAYTYTTASGTIGIAEPTGDVATVNATETQPDWDSILTPTESGTETLRPNATGTYSQCDANGDSPNYACVDEVTADEDSTYVSTWGGATELDTYNIADHSEGIGTVTSVTVYIRTRVTSDSHAVEVALRTNGTDYFGTYTPISSTSYTDISATWTTNPYTTNAWTWAEIDVLEIGVRHYDLGTGYLLTTQVYVEVDWEALALLGEVPTGDLFAVTPNALYSGDLIAKVYLANPANLIKAYRYLNMKLYVEGSVSANETPNYRMLTLQNGEAAFTLEELQPTSGTWTQTSQADFESGNLTQLDTTTSPGDVLLDTFSDNETFRPNAAGDNTSISSQYPPSGAHYDKVDDVTSDDWSTYVYTNSTSYQQDLYSIPDHVTGSGPVDNVTAYFRFAKTSAAGDVGIWRDTNNSHTIGLTGAWTDVPFNSEVKSDDSFNQTSTTTVDILATGRYLIMYEIRSTSTSNSRHGIMSRVTLEGVAVEGSEGYGYSRNNANDEAYTAGVCIVEANLNDTVVIQWQPIDVSSSDVLSNSKTSLMMIRLPDSSHVAYAKYTDDTDTSNFNGTAWNNVDYEDIAEETDTSVIQKSAVNDYTFTLKKNARYLVKYNIGFDQGNSTRTTRSARATLAASAVENSHSNVYLRSSDVDPEWLHAFFIVEVTSAPQDLIIQSTRRSGTDVDGSITRRTSASSLEIVELPSDTEVCSFYDNTGGQNVGASTILNLARNEKFRDSASFTSPDNVHIEVEQDDDYLFMSSGYVEDPDKTSSTRLEFGVDFYLDDSLQYVGGHGNFKRGAQATSDTWDTGWNAHAILNDLTANQRVEVRTVLDGDGGGTNDNTVASECGFSALRIGSLATGDVYARAAIKTHGTVHYGDEESTATDTFVTESYQWTTNPDTLFAWTWGEIDALQIGVELKADSADNNAVCTQVYVVVNYTAYYPTGTLLSSDHDAGDDDIVWDWLKIYFTIAEPSETDIVFQIRTAANITALDSATWYGPTSPTDNYTSSGTAINPVHDGDRWIQYKAYFSGPSDDTPTLSDITITYTATAVVYTVEVIGGGYCLVSDNTSEWGTGWTVIPELYCEATHR